MKIKNQSVGKNPTTMLIKSGTSVGSGEILGPDCNVQASWQSSFTTDAGFTALNCTFSPDLQDYTCKDRDGNVVTPTDVQGNVTIIITDPNTGAIYEIHVTYIKEDSAWVGTGSPCSYLTRLINGKLVIVGVGTDCIKCGTGGSCPTGKTCCTTVDCFGYCK
jgi:hypothetical protein